jgi:AcrR family transcriptional regulator
MPNQTFYNLPEEKKERITQAIIDECSTHTFEHINLSNIVRNSNIPRGSFYQYFKDKSDVFDFVYGYIGQVKMKFIGDLMHPSHDIPFLKRFESVYIAGMHFASSYPKLMKAGQKMMESEIFKQNDMLKKATDAAIQFYVNFIKIDQQKGLIRSDIDPVLLASVMIEFSNKVSLAEYMKDTVDQHAIEYKVKGLIDLIKRGIDAHV